VIAARALIVVDNATSHAREIEAFSRAITASPGHLGPLVPIGDGELVILKKGGPA
jgi:hypothetical protein